jgi:hypothetical protein
MIQYSPTRARVELELELPVAPFGARREVTEKTCAASAKALGLCSAPLPLELEDVPIIQAWHPLDQRDEAHTWLRGQVRQIVEALCAARTAGP